MPAPVPELESHVGYWLRMLSNAVSHAFARALAAHDVTVAEWVVLRVLFDGEGMAPSRLAARMGMTKGAITRLADRLVTKGLVSRQAAGADRRAQILALRPEGRTLVPLLAGLAEANEAAFFAPLAPEERERLQGLLRKLAAAHDLRAPPTD